MSFDPSRHLCPDTPTLPIPKSHFDEVYDTLLPVMADVGTTMTWETLGALTIVTSDGDSLSVTVYYGDPPLGAFSIDGKYFRGGNSNRFCQVIGRSLDLEVFQTMAEERDVR
jgi:hypothetical protein